MHDLEGDGDVGSEVKFGGRSSWNRNHRRESGSVSSASMHERVGPHTALQRHCTASIVGMGVVILLQKS